MRTSRGSASEDGLAAMFTPSKQAKNTALCCRHECRHTRQDRIENVLSGRLDVVSCDKEHSERGVGHGGGAHGKYEQGERL